MSNITKDTGVTMTQRQEVIAIAESMVDIYGAEHPDLGELIDAQIEGEGIPFDDVTEDALREVWHRYD